MAVAPNWKTLFDAVEKGELADVKRIVQEGLPASTADPKGETAAHLAARKRNFAILEYLLNQDRSLLTSKNKAGQNVLYLAVEHGAIDIVKYLVDDCNVDIFHADNLRSGDSVVHVAARAGHMDILKYFVEQKQVDVNVRNEKGESPAFSAAGNKKLPIIVYLLEQHNADMMMVDYENRNILFPAAMKGDATVPTYILDQKRIELAIDWRDKLGRTVLHYSARSNYLKATKYFVEVHHADVNMPDLMRQTPLHLAAEAGHIKIVEFLYELGADPELPDATEKIPIQLAKDKKVIKFLTEFPKQKTRQRRSVPGKPPPPSLHRSASASQSLWARGIAADALSPSRNYLSDVRGGGLENVAPVGALDHFLMLASAYVGRWKRAINVLEPVSPTKNVDSRVDPVALEVIR